MKTLSFTLSLLMGACLFFSCQQEEIATPSQQITNRTHDCSVVCIDPDAPVYHPHSGSVSEQFGNNNDPKFRTFNYTYYNTLTSFVVNWAHTGENGGRQLNFVVSIPALSWTTNQVTACGNPPRTGTLTFALPAGWESCMDVNFTAILEECTGNDKATNTGTYDLVGECIAECVIDSADYFTYSQGFYLRSQNGAAFLNANPTLAPVNVGCGDNITSYSIAQIIALETGNSGPGILVKQIITMTLNVNASAAGILGLNDDLGCLVVVADGDPLTTLDDLFAGLTVSEIIAAANNYAGGCDTTTYTEGDLTAILEAIVDNFHVGETPGELLTCCE